MPGSKPLPHMGSRKGQSLVESSQQKDAQKSSVTPFDGDGKFHEGVEITAAAPKVLHHGLGRMPRGYIVCRAQSDNTLDGWFAEAARDAKTYTFANDATGNLTVDLWIF